MLLKKFFSKMHIIKCRWGRFIYFDSRANVRIAKPTTKTYKSFQQIARLRLHNSIAYAPTRFTIWLHYETHLFIFCFFLYFTCAYSILFLFLFFSLYLFYILFCIGRTYWMPNVQWMENEKKKKENNPKKLWTKNKEERNE